MIAFIGMETSGELRRRFQRERGRNMTDDPAVIGLRAGLRQAIGIAAMLKARANEERERDQGQRRMADRLTAEIEQAIEMTYDPLRRIGQMHADATERAAEAGDRYASAKAAGGPFGSAGSVDI